MSSVSKRSCFADSSISTKRTRKALDMGIKMKIIEAYENGKRITQIARVHGLSASTVSTIVKDKHRIREAVKEEVGLKSTILTKRRRGIILEMEKQLMNWIGDHLQQKNAVTLPMIQTQAINIFNDLKQQKGETCCETFTASKGWYQRFKRRFDLQDFQDNMEVVTHVYSSEKFHDDSDMIDEKFLIPEQMLSVDETNFIHKIDTRDSDIKQEGKKSTRKTFTPKGLADFFSKLDEGLRLLENMDSDNERFSKVERKIYDAVQCYRDIYESPIPMNVSDISKPSTSTGIL